MLAIELPSLAEIDFELEVTGFATAEIDLLIGDVEPTNDVDPADGSDGLEPEGPIRQDPARSRAFSARSRTPTESSSYPEPGWRSAGGEVAVDGVAGIPVSVGCDAPNRTGRRSDSQQDRER